MACNTCCGSELTPILSHARGAAHTFDSGGMARYGGRSPLSAQPVAPAPRVFSAPQAFPAIIGEIVPPSQLSGGMASAFEPLGAGFIEGSFRLIDEQRALAPAPYYTQFEGMQSLPTPTPLMLPEPSQDLIMQYALENVAQAVDV